MFDELVERAVGTVLGDEVKFSRLLDDVHTPDDIGVFQTRQRNLLGHEQITLDFIVDVLHVDYFDSDLLTGSSVDAYVANSSTEIDGAGGSLTKLTSLVVAVMSNCHLTGLHLHFLEAVNDI